MSVSILTLSLDSLLAAFVVSAAVSPRHYARLAVLFGACDMAGSALAPLLTTRITIATTVISALAVLWGALLLFNRRHPAISGAHSPMVYLLPPLLALDNLLVPGTSPWLAGLASSAMAAGGFALGAVALRRFVVPTYRRRWLDASFVACGLLLNI